MPDSRFEVRCHHSHRSHGYTRIGRMEILAGDEPPLPKPHHVAFVLPMDQPDAAIEALTAGGAQLNPVTVTPAGDKLLFFFDPAGNYMQIVCRVNAMEP